MDTEGFHDGELYVQRRAGARQEASRLAGMLAAPHIDGATSRFAADRDTAFITCRGGDGVLWTSALHGSPGFCRAQGRTVEVAARPIAGDPLHDLRPGRPVGLLLIDFQRRRRVRINGALTRVDQHGLVVRADQAFGNCPRYIQQRHLHRAADARPTAGAVHRAGALRAGDVAVVRHADTFVLGTTHPTRGPDTSHRGGAPGFVRIDDDGNLWWPDYPGNNLFNSLGNIVADPSASLLFVDFTLGVSLQLSGRARLEWTRPGIPGDDAGTGRRVRLAPDQLVVTSGPPCRAPGLVPYPKNPVLT